MAGNDKNIIRITHFINPHMFWFKYESSFFSNARFLEFDNEIQQYFLKDKPAQYTRYQPKKGQIIGFYNFAWSRWIRAEVDFIAEYASSETKYICWAIDYGIPIICNSSATRKLPQRLTEPDLKLVYFGGLNNVVPADLRYSFEVNRAQLVAADSWSQVAVKNMEELINDACLMRFEQEFECKGQLFGTLKITHHTNAEVNLRELLLDMNLAMAADDFLNTLQETGINQIQRWKTNDGNSHVFQTNNSKWLQFTLAKSVPSDVAKSEYSINAVRKVQDWERRNEMSKQNDQVGNQESTDGVGSCNSSADLGIQVDDISIEKAILESIVLSDQKNSYICPIENEGSSQDDKKITSGQSEKNKKLERLRKIRAIHNQTQESTCKSDSVSPTRSVNLDEKFPKQIIKTENHQSNTNTKSPNRNSERRHKKKNKRQQNVKIHDNNVGECINNDKSIEIGARLHEINSQNMTLNGDIQILVQEDKSGSIEDHEIKPKPPTTEIEVLEVLKSMNLNAGDIDATATPSQGSSEHQKSNVKSLMDRLAYKRKLCDPIIKTTTISNCSKDVIIPAGIDLNVLRTNKKTETHNNKSLKNNKEPCLEWNLVKHLVLVHGTHFAKPIDKLQKANFTDDIHQELQKMGFTQIYRTQSFTWPHLMRGNSLIVVNGAKTGKTLSYLPAFCSLVQLKIKDQLVVDGVGPIGIILAASSVEVMQITNKCRRMLQNSDPHISVVDSFGARHESEAKIGLLNGCGILVATPASLARLLRAQIPYIDGNRVQHFVVDGLDKIYGQFTTELQMCLRKCCSLSGKNAKTSTQLIITSRKWMKVLTGFFNICNNPQLCIGSYLEAAIYARSTICTKFVENSTKISVICDFIEKHPYTLEPLMIVCSKDEEVDEISKVLRNISAMFIAVCGTSTAEEIELTKDWDNREISNRTLIVCTDSVLPELKVTKVKNLIHYSLSKTWTKFSFRFSVCLGYYEDFVKSIQNSKPPAISIILLDENNNYQLPKLIQFLQEHGCDSIHSKIVDLSHQILLEREESKSEAGMRKFCPSMMEFGNCADMNICKHRHMLTKFDAPTDRLPIDGFIKVKILNILSPTHYAVRILNKKKDNNSKWLWSDENTNYGKFNLEFSCYFAVTERHQIHWPINTGDLCVINENSIFYRCKVLQVPENYNENVPGNFDIVVKLVDHGREIVCKSASVLVLPDKFKKIPFQAVDLRLMGIAPFDHEQIWDIESTDIVRHWFSQYDNRNVHVEARVNFALMNTIWSDSVIMVEFLQPITTHVMVMDIKSTLLEKKFAQKSSCGAKLLFETAKNFGFLKCSETDAENGDHFEELSSDSLINIENLNNTNESLSSIVNTENDSSKQSASTVEINNIEEIKTDHWQTVIIGNFFDSQIGSFISPDHFFIQLLHLIPDLENLYSKIDKYINSEDCQLLINPEINMNCLAKFDGSYNRAKIIALEGNNTVELFFCDIGSTKLEKIDCLFEIPKHLQDILPFQAIFCKLSGIKPLKTCHWSDETSDKIYDEILDVPDYLLVKSLNITKIKVFNAFEIDQHEIIFLSGSTKENNKLINCEIVESGFAEYSVQKESLLNFITSKNDQNVGTDSNMENWDNCNYKNPIFANVDEVKEEKSDSSFDSLDIQMTQKEMLDVLGISPNINKLLASIRENSERSAIDNKNTPKNDLQTIEEVTTNQQKVSEIINIMPRLKYLYPCPKTIWKQTKDFIILNIYAPDIIDYGIEITADHLTFKAKINDEQHALLINFLGIIVPESSIHKIIGLRVHVRLEKISNKFSWPRLTNENDKYSWLKYDLNAITLEDEEQDAICNRLVDINKINTDVSDSETSEENDDYWSNTNRIEDPFDDEFSRPVF